MSKSTVIANKLLYALALLDSILHFAFVVVTMVEPYDGVIIQSINNPGAINATESDVRGWIDDMNAEGQAGFNGEARVCMF